MYKWSGGFWQIVWSSRDFLLQMLVVILTLALTLGYASARDGESCVSTNCLFVDNCFKSVKVSTLREAITGEKWCFFEHCSKGLCPPPPPFIWTFVLFCGGYFLNAFLSIKNGSNKEKNIFGGINCRGRAPLNQRSFERCSKKFGHCSKICAMFKNSLFVYDGVP